MLAEEALRELTELRGILAQHPALYKRFYEAQCVEAMLRTVMLRDVPLKHLEHLSKLAVRVEYPKGEVLVREGMDGEHLSVIIVQSGDVKRTIDVDGRIHAVTTFDDTSIGFLHLFGHNTARFNAECTTPVVAYQFKKSDIEHVMKENPAVTFAMIQSLTAYIRHSQFSLSTPLLEQKAHAGNSVTAVCLGASIEAFFRSAMNAVINQRLMGGVRGALFPNMHIQIPNRILYINGLKQIRFALQEIDTTNMDNPLAWQLLCSFLPGILMCPFASVLEGANVVSDESVLRRWRHGYSPRLCREVIFGIGINQLSDWCSERFQDIESTFVRGCCGSIAAGITAGYFSHIPHVMSTLKLMQPHLGYGELWTQHYTKYLTQLPPSIPSHRRAIAAKVLSVVFPLGVVRRSCQIAGTFILINSTVFMCRDQNWY
jgi:hypothetical protein